MNPENGADGEVECGAGEEWGMRPLDSDGILNYIRTNPQGTEMSIGKLKQLLRLKGSPPARATDADEGSLYEEMGGRN